MRRRGLSLLEVIVAVGVLAAIGGPLMANIVMARRTVFSSSHDVRAVIAAGKAAEALLGVPYDRLPVASAAATSDLDGEVPGVGRGGWATAFPTEDGARVDLAELLGDTDEEGHTLHVWIEELDAETLGTGRLRAKELTLTVRYEASGPDVKQARTYTLRAVKTDRIDG